MSDTIHRYRILKPIGKGAVGEVFAVEDPSLGVRRALKILHSSVATDPKVRQRFDQEARTLAQLHHPHLVAVYDVGETDGRPWLVMDLVEGGSLADRVARRGRMTETPLLRDILGILDALGVVHAAGIIHRDIKPQNLLYDADGRMRLADFGIALVDSVDLTQTGVILGSWGFMAPEQRMNPRQFRAATDLFGVAASMAWALVGAPVTDLHVAEHRAVLLKDVSPEVRGILSRALAFQPEERFRSAAEMASAIRAIGQPAPTDASGALPPLPVRAAARGTPIYASGILVGLAIGAGVMRWIDGSSTSTAETNPPADATPALPACPVTVSDWVEDFHSADRETVGGAVADLDGDGLLDPFYTNQYDETLTIWWGRPKELPSEFTNITIGRSGGRPRSGDVDGDGIIDIVAVLQDESAIGYLRGLGNRKFATIEKVFQSPPAFSAVLVDTNDDRQLDLVMTTLGDRVNVRLRNGAEWLPHRQFLNINPHDVLSTWMQGPNGPLIALSRNTSFAEPYSVLYAMDGAATVAPPWVVRWVDRDAAADHRTAYAVTDKRRLVQWNGVSWCEVGPAPHVLPWAVADLTGDGTLDAVSSESCRMCSSNHVFFKGMPGTR